MILEDLDAFQQRIRTGECSELLCMLPAGSFGTAAGASAKVMEDAQVCALLSAIQCEPTYLQTAEHSLLTLLQSKQVFLADLAPASAGKLVFVDQLFKRMMNDPLLDRTVAQGLWPLKTVVARLFLQQNLFDSSLSLPLITLIDTTALMLMGWWPECSELNCTQRCALVLKNTQHILQHSADDTSALVHLGNTLQQQWQKEQEKNAKIIRRVIDAEVGRMKLHHSELQIADLYNANCLHLSLPPVLIEFLHGPWHNVLLRILLQKQQSPEQMMLWKRAAQLTRLMIISVQAEAHLKKVFTKFETLSDDIQSLLTQAQCGKTEIEFALNTIIHCQQDMFKGNIAHYIAAPLIEKGRYFNDSHLNVSAHLKNKITQLQIGDCFVYQAEHMPKQLLQLAHHETALGHMLFVGVDTSLRSMRSVDDVAFQLSTGLLTKVKRGEFFNRHFNASVQFCWRVVTRQQELITLKQAEETQQKTAKQHEEQQQALQEKILLVRSLKEQYQKENKTREELRKQAKSMVTMLNLGAWITIHRTDNDSVRAKLAVRMTSSNKLIFVDRSGLRIAEYSTQELLEKIICGEVEVINQGEDFNRTLSHVVGRLV